MRVLFQLDDKNFFNFASLRASPSVWKIFKLTETFTLSFGEKKNGYSD